jgi:voltage-gated potassium channel
VPTHPRISRFPSSVEWGSVHTTGRGRRRLARPQARHVVSALVALVVIVLLGGTGLWLAGGNEYPLWECLYFALYTVSTVGYAELPHFANHPGIHWVVGLLIVAGVGAIAFFQSALTVMFVEGVIGKAVRRRRMERKIARLSQHVIIAGCGRTGRYVIGELIAGTVPFVVIERDEDTLLNLYEEFPQVLYIPGDATADNILMQAGADRAKGLVACLSDDRDNLFVTLSVRALNPQARITAKVVDVANETKVVRAGADSTVNPNRIGGKRLASELLRPHVIEFLDEMLKVTQGQLHFDEVELVEGTSVAGRTLRDVPIRTETNLLVVAVRQPNGTYTYNPSPDERLTVGEKLIVMGLLSDVERLKQMVRPQAP